MSDSLFSKSPLAEALRPRTLADVVGQPDVTAAMAARQGGSGSVVLWGPPGTGKTTLARILGEEAEQRFVACLLYTSPSPRDGLLSRMPSSA